MRMIDPPAMIRFVLKEGHGYSVSELVHDMPLVEMSEAGLLVGQTSGFMWQLDWDDITDWYEVKR